jgi:dolichol-phosphate mannosyltransferase
VVVPTYNEAENVQPLVRQLLALDCQPDVLIVDDNSPDGTGALVQALVSTYPGRVQLLTRQNKQGLGAAYAHAFRQVLIAGYEVVVQMDADFSHDPQDVDRLVAATDHADVAIGSRYVPGGDVPAWSWHRRLLSRGGNLYARRVLGLPVQDLTAVSRRGGRRPCDVLT